MASEVFNVLFLCTGNSARSIMAEAILESEGRRRFKAYSAGSFPTGRVNPLAIELLKQNGLATEGLRSKSWDEFARPGAPFLHFVFTVCDQAASEPCPIWPGQPITAHWGVPDPAAFQGSAEEKSKMFWDTAVILKRRLELMLALPLASLDSMSIQREIRDIGTR